MNISKQQAREFKARYQSDTPEGRRFRDMQPKDVAYRLQIGENTVYAWLREWKHANGIPVRKSPKPHVRRTETAWERRRPPFTRHQIWVMRQIAAWPR